MEGSGFRDRTPEFEALGASIVGISFDTPAENLQFAAGNDLPFPLLSDRQRSIGEQYGAARDPDHRYAAFARRVTLVIDPDGIVQFTYVIAPTQIADHPGRVLADLQRLMSTQS